MNKLEFTELTDQDIRQHAIDLGFIGVEFDAKTCDDYIDRFIEIFGEPK